MWKMTFRSVNGVVYSATSDELEGQTELEYIRYCLSLESVLVSVEEYTPLKVFEDNSWEALKSLDKFRHCQEEYRGSDGYHVCTMPLNHPGTTHMSMGTESYFVWVKQ